MPTEISGSTGVNKIQDGTVVNADINSSAAIAGSKLVMPTGSIVQVTQTVFSTFTQINNSSSYIATGLSGSITPQSSSNKILVIISHNISTNNVGGQNIQCRLQRGSTVIRAYDNITASSDSNTGGSHSLVFLDSPNTTSSTTYSTLMKGTSSDHFRINNYNSSSGDACSTITLMEVAA